MNSKDSVINSIDFTKVVPVEKMRGDDETDTSLLKEYYQYAVKYISKFKWCEGIRGIYYGIGIGGIFGVFLFHITPLGKNVDDWVWIIVGDIPPAYITVDQASNPASALDGYIGAMEEWVKAVKAGKDVSDLIPVNVSPTRERAIELESRLEFLNENILSSYSKDLEG